MRRAPIHAEQTLTPSLPGAARARAALFLGAGLTALALLAGCDSSTAPASHVPDVEDAGPSVVVGPDNVVIHVGDSAVFAAVVTDQKAAPQPNATVTWHTSKPDVARITEHGVATGLKVGTTLVIATGNGGASDSTLLTVTALGDGGDTTSSGGDQRCGGVAQTAAWDGGLSIDYQYDAAGNKLSYSIGEKAQLQFHIPRMTAGVWSGPVTGTYSVNERETDSSATPPRVTTVTGTGAPVVSAGGQPGSVVTIAVDLASCTYQLGLELHGNVGQGTGPAGPALIASLRTGWESLEATQLRLEELPAHSPFFYPPADDGVYYPMILAPQMFVQGVANDADGAGTATVSWGFSPAPPPTR